MLRQAQHDIKQIVYHFQRRSRDRRFDDRVRPDGRVYGDINNGSFCRLPLSLFPEQEFANMPPRRENSFILNYVDDFNSASGPEP